MIRSLLALSLAFVSVSAYATPQVGDFSLFDANIALNGQQTQGSVQMELAQFDASKNQFLMRQTVQLPGRAPQITDEWKDASGFLSDATIDNVLANCASAGGTPMQLTVPAGTFNACAINFDEEDSSGTAYVAKVPFGIARQDTTIKRNGMTISLSLRQYR